MLQLTEPNSIVQHIHTYICTFIHIYVYIYIYIYIYTHTHTFILIYILYISHLKGAYIHHIIYTILYIYTIYHHWRILRSSYRMSFQVMSSSRTQSQLCKATPISLFVQCKILFRLLTSSVATLILIEILYR